MHIDNLLCILSSIPLLPSCVCVYTGELVFPEGYINSLTDVIVT